MLLFRVIGLLGLMALIPGNIPEGLGNPQSDGIRNRSPKSAKAQNVKEQSNSSYRIKIIREWSSAVTQHHPGVADAVAVSISRWPAADIKIAVDYAAKQARQPLNAAKRLLAREQTQRLLNLTDQEVQTGNFGRLLKQGALLHTDIALLELGTGENPDDKVYMRAFVDGHAIANVSPLHWTIARQLISAIPRSPAQAQLERQWYVATTAFLQDRRLQAYADQNLKCALKIYPSDAIFLFYAGVLHETWASPLNQNIQLPPLLEATYGSKESELKLARDMFRKALAVNPNYAEAHLRLGRVLGLLGNHRQALAELQLAAASIKEPPLSYYLCLFLGREFEMLSYPAQAGEYYLQAAALYPAAQSPLLALSHLARENAGTRDALLPIQRILTLPRKDLWKDDPWWAYDRSHTHDAEALVAEMRRMLGAPFQ